jgi:DNA polymerase
MAPDEGTQIGDDEMDPRTEARALIASARVLIQEFAEEDVQRFERLPDAKPSETAAAAPRPADKKPAPATPRPQPAAAARAPAKPPLDGEGMPWAGRTPSLDEVRTHLGDCRRCGLCEGRQEIVFGDGNPDADILFVGEGPGEQEDRQGLPFVGRAGELLTQMIEKGIGIQRSDVYICNIVKCRPPQNRNPLPPEVAACRPFLDGQIEAVAPKVIVTLGKPAATLLLGREIAITRERGVWQSYRDIPLMPTLHPAYVLRQYTPENRRAVWQDLKAALERSRL